MDAPLRALLLDRVRALGRSGSARARVGGVFFLFGVGAAAVAAIASGAAPWVVAAAAAGGLALYLAGWARRDPAPWAAAALGGAVFPALEALCIWLGARCGRPTWEYAPWARGWLGVPGYLWPLWACAGAFVVALHDGAGELAAAALRAAPDALRPQQPAGAAAAQLFGGFGALMVATVALVVWAPPGGAAAGMAAMAAAALAALPGERQAGAKGAVLLPALATAGAVAAAFPLLEALCVRAAGAWRYHDGAGLVPGLRVPAWLWPLWALNAAAFMQAGAAARAAFAPP